MPAKKKSPSKKSDKKDHSKNAATRDRRRTAQIESKHSKEVFPKVGIGASAGGLEALEVFFENLPVESGIAFVVVTHTDPRHTSLLPSIIRRKTNLTVKLVEEGLPVEPNTVYLPPPGKCSPVRAAG